MIVLVVVSGVQLGFILLFIALIYKSG